MTLWALLLLAAMAVALGRRVGGVVDVAEAQARRTDGYARALAGVETALAAICADTNGWDSAHEGWRSRQDLFAATWPDGGGYRVCDASTAGVWTADGGTAAVWGGPGVGDEEGRLNLNLAEQRLLTVFFEVAADMPPEDAARLTFALMDWRDVDHDVSADGAEDDQYRAAGRPYGAGDGPLALEDELRLVRGMSDEIMARLRPLVTVHGTGRVNVNAAGRVVLASVMVAANGGGRMVCERLADKVLRYRAAGGVFRDPGRVADDLDAFERLLPVEKNILTRMAIWGVMSTSSSCFRGVATGWGAAGEERGQRTVFFVYDRARDRMARWSEQ